MSDKLPNNEQGVNGPLDFDVVYAALNQAYDNYQKLCFELIVNQEDYPYCIDLLRDLLTIHRTIFSNEYRNFFHMMYRTAPAILFYLMQFQDAREIFFGSQNLVVNYRLLEKLVVTSQNYVQAAAFLKDKAKRTNKSFNHYKKFLDQVNDPDFVSFELDRLAMIDDGKIDSLHDPDKDVFFPNINLNTRALDGRTTLGREIKQYLNDEVGEFNWSDVPRPKARRYLRKDNESLSSSEGDDLGYLQASSLAQRLHNESNLGNEGCVPPQEMGITKAPKTSKQALETLKNMEQADNKIALEQSYEVEPKEQFFVSPMVNNNTFGLMELFSNAPAFGPINANRTRNYDLPGLSAFQKQPHQILTVDLKDHIESLGALLEKERMLMARQLRRLSMNFQRLCAAFGSRVSLITVNPNAMGSVEQTIEEFEQDCLIIYVGSDLLVRPTNSLLADVKDSAQVTWLDQEINENFMTITGLELKLNLDKVSLPLPKRHKSFSLKQTYNVWKKQTNLNKFSEGIYRIEVPDLEIMPLMINTSTFGPYDLVYIKL